MPRFRITERRAFHNTVLIDAKDEDDARTFTGDIIEESAEESWGDEIVDVVQVDDDENEV